MYDFLSTSPLKTKWRLMYGLMEALGAGSLDMSDKRRFAHPRFDASEHNLLCSELKQL